MMLDEGKIQSIVRQVIEEVRGKSASALRPTGYPPSPAVIRRPPKGRGMGVFDDIAQAIGAAKKAFRDLEGMSIQRRKDMISAIRGITLEHAEDFSTRTRDETGLGRLADKLAKHKALAELTPGVEDIEQQAWAGDYGLTVDDCAPFGVIGAVLPSTHPVPTMVGNAICMIAAGNAVVFNPHPGAKNVSAYALQMLNRVIQETGGPENLLTMAADPCIETTHTVFRHPDVDLLVVTGGGGVVQAALSSKKRAICAGPGNPPAVVDDTCCLSRAAGSIIEGGGFDNNILCIGEKIMIVLDHVADRFKRELTRHGAVELDRTQIDHLTRQAFQIKPSGAAQPTINRTFIGRNASVLAEAIGVSISDDVRILFGETPVDHCFVQQEQMMPFLPLVRAQDVDHAIAIAKEVEHGYGHTAVMHSSNVVSLTKMGRIMKVTIFVKNGPSPAGLGIGGEGTCSFSIAGTTGEGITTPRTFTRQRRCAMIGQLNIV